MRIPSSLVACLFALTAASTVACGSSSSGGPEAVLRGVYRATTAGAISSVTFKDTTHYSMVRSVCSDGKASCSEEGTYALGSDDSTVDFTPNGGVTYTYPFLAIKAEPTSLGSIALRILDDGTPLTSGTPSSLTSGSGSSLTSGNGSSLTSGSGADLVSQIAQALVQAFQMAMQAFDSGQDAGGGSGFDAGFPVQVDAGVDSGVDAGADGAVDGTAG
jgi:hypothetical protein